MKFWKGHALGNDYIILDRTGADPPGGSLIRGLCDRHRGVGGDGVLVADLARDPVGLRIFNPDGSEAEKSGNGLRIFGAWLYGQGHVSPDGPFQVALPGETVEMRVESIPSVGPLTLRVEMGRASFRAGDIPYSGASADSEVQGDLLELRGEAGEDGGAGEEVRIHLVSLGNPHCVVFVDELDTDTFRRWGPRLQSHPAFERGVNVQLARSPEPGVLEAWIWERGAGETLASGSSACAVAVAALRSGLVTDRELQVRMRGGAVSVAVGEDWRVRLTGEAGVVFEGRVAEGVVRAWEE